MASTISNFYEGTSVSFDVTISVDDVVQDIRDDIVTIIFKRQKSDSDSEAVLTFTADVLTSGENGIAEFDLTSTDTSIEPRIYYYEIKWVSGTTVEILLSSTVTVLDRIYD